MPYRKEIKRATAGETTLSSPPFAKGGAGGLLFFASFSLLMALSIFCFGSSVDARVKGKCKDCHSMHYSYEGREATYGDRKGPFPVLTKGGCAGCHGQNPAGDRSIITTGKSRIPQILHRMENSDLAGGNYYYVADGYNPDYSKGHNVTDISNRENPPMDVPPAFIGNVFIAGGYGPVTWPAQQQLTCAGMWGCHGNRTTGHPFKSMYGAHHTDDKEIDGTTVGTSYRFLYGITGWEHEDWEYLATTHSHNSYKGAVVHDSVDTISYLCGECHAKFHPNAKLGGISEVGLAFTAGWHKHPTDIAFYTVRGGFAGSEYQQYVSYSLEAPVAFYKPEGKETKVDENGIVMCLSCHRAHASPYPDILRWDYPEMNTRTSVAGRGCMVCHTRKGAGRLD